ncbi:hypothetical protein GQ651_09325 [Alphaproteobacteria bacterium GH1-50]|uniref:Uncharacterized protein n=1 Tax=Kangsaoukella pontilimi TaxID=2691042 RepID=A0A7C9IQR7_9RHOB|nr:hypothetical protein [Kangsaoukella pontilimi]MXQ08043.1 hypothetical protein [Kangsaoukella pontilimi]
MNESEASPETLKAVDMVNGLAARFVERLLMLKYVDTPDGQAAAMKQAEEMSRFFVEQLDELSDSPACRNVHVKLAIAEARADIEHIAGDFAVLRRVTKYTADRHRGGATEAARVAEEREAVRHYFNEPGDTWKTVKRKMEEDGADVPTDRALQARLTEIRKGR